MDQAPRRESMPVWLKEDKRGVVICCHIQPGGSRSEVVGEHGERIKIKIKAPPVDGKANKELIAFLSKLLRMPKSSLGILRGETSRQKDVLCLGADLELISERFK